MQRVYVVCLGITFFATSFAALGITGLGESPVHAPQNPVSTREHSGEEPERRLHRLSPTDEVWVDAQRKSVIGGQQSRCFGHLRRRVLDGLRFIEHDVIKPVVFERGDVLVVLDEVHRTGLLLVVGGDLPDFRRRLERVGRARPP